MIRALPGDLRTTCDQQSTVVVAVLDQPDRKAVLRTALALSAGRPDRVKAWTCHRPGEELSLQHRIAVYGLAPRTSADRAIAHLVQEAVRGAHATTRSFAADDDSRSRDIRSLHELGPDCTLVVGWPSKTATEAAEVLGPLLREHPGPVVITTGRQVPPFDTVFVATLSPEGDRGNSGHSIDQDSDDNSEPYDQLLDSLSSCYPVYRRTVNPTQLREALREAGPEVLVVVVVRDARDLGEGDWGQLVDRVEGELCLLVPEAGTQRDEVLAQLNPS